MRLPTWFASTVLVALFCAAPLWAQPDAAAGSVSSPDDGETSREIAQLETLLRGELPEGVALAQLFPYSLLDEKVLAEQRARLEAELQALAAPEPEPGQDDPAKVRVLQLRLQILGSGVDLRGALVDADTRREAAQRELEQAEAERKRAEAAAQAAEEARRKALEAAEAARSAAEKFFATELAKIENVRLEQAQLKQQLAEQRVSLRSDEIDSAGEQVRQRIQQALPGAPENRALYEEAVLAVVSARAALRASLDAVDNDVNIPRYRIPEQLPDELSLGEARASLENAARALQGDTRQLAAEVRRLRHDRAAAEYARLERLNRSRIELLPKLQEADRDEILGLGPVGFEQLRRELDQLRLQFAWYRHARANLGYVWASFTEDNDRMLRVVRGGVLFILMCAAALWITRRRQGWLDVAGAQVVRFVHSPYLRRFALGVLGLIERVFPEMLLVIVALAAPSVLGTLAEIAEVVLVLELFLMFATYRLLLTLTYLLISWLSVGGGVLPSRLRRLTLQSLQLAGIYLLATLFILLLSQQALGRGYLYSVVANIWWLGGIPIALVLVRWWQPDIADGYLRFRDTGTMANMVRASRNRWYGFFVTAIAVVVLMVVAVGRLAARFALGFDQTRKALAFLFRRRLERQADAQGEHEQPKLDPELIEVLSEDPDVVTDLLTARFPGKEEFLERIGKWVEGGPAEPTLLVGDTGYGKTTWLASVERSLNERDIVTHRLTPPHHLATSEALLGWLSASLKLPGGSWEKFCESLAEREREVVMIDDGHMLFSRALNGFEAWDALCEVAGTATSRVVWVVAVARFPFDYLAWARNGLTAPFRRIFKLKPWTDTEIAELLRTRMTVAGYRVRYDDLVAEHVEGVRQQTQLLRTETEYARLIWDYSDGCPRTALRCWRASLAPAGEKTVSVRLFRRPDLRLLERLTRRERFVLAALVWHQILTADMATSVLRFSRPQCEDILAMLRDARVAYERDGVFRLESDWLQPVRRLLRRENLIVA